MNTKTSLIDCAPPILQPDDTLEVEINSGDLCIHYYSATQCAVMVHVPIVGWWLLTPEGPMARA